jgi:hypothetical protein
MNIILLAFDGLSSRDVIDEDRYLLKQCRQFYNTEEIDLGERDIYFTSELFTDLITGERREQHGVKGLKKFTKGKYGLTPQNFELWLQQNIQPFFLNGVSLGPFNLFDRSFRTAMYQGFLDSHYRKWEREDIETETIFDKYPYQAHQNQVPVYDWRLADVFHHLKDENKSVQKCHRHILEEWEKSKTKFWRSVEEVEWGSDKPQFYIHHFHYIDWLQHLYRNGEFDEGIDKLNDHWWSVNEFIKEVKDFADEDTEVIVMSDHGIPARYIGHKPNAFISHNIDQIPENPSLNQIHDSIENILQEQ